MSTMSAQAEQSGTVSIGDIAGLTGKVRAVANDKIAQIQKVTSRVRILALNAMIEAERAGDSGRGQDGVSPKRRSPGLSR